MRAFTAPVAVLSFVVLAACGPSVGDGSGSGSDSGSTGASDGVSDTAMDSTSSSSPSGGSNEATSAANTTATSLTSGGSTTRDRGGSSSSSGPGTAGTGCEAQELEAVLVPGGLDRIFVFHQDGDFCFWLTFAYPGPFGDEYEVMATGQWGLEHAVYTYGEAACEAFPPPSAPEDAIEIAEAWGNFTVDGHIYRTCAAGIDVSLQLLTNPDPPIYFQLCDPMLDLQGCGA